MNKKLHLTDSHDIHDNKVGFLKTNVIFKDHDTQEVIWKGRNKVILPGAEFLALHVFHLPTDVPITPSYNTSLDLENTIYSNPPLEPNKAFLWCVGTDGCGRENSQVYEVDYRKWIMPVSMVPFKYPLTSDDLTPAERNIYFGRQLSSSNWPHPNNYAYYFKRFDSDPTLIRRYTDGTGITSTVYDDITRIPVETYVEMSMSITKDDCREFFYYTTGINDARINTMSLCTAYARDITDPVSGNTYVYYQDIRPITKLNFPNEPLIDLNKGIDIIYQVYF